MSVGATNSFAKLQHIGDMVTRIGQVNRTNTDKTMQTIQIVQDRSDQASAEVVNNAMDVKSKSMETKGRIIDVMA